MNCIAIDDEPVALSVLARYCERMGGMELKCYSDPVVGMREVKIVYIEAMDNYVRIHLCGARPALSQMSLKSLAELLPATFVRIHKSFIVPLHRIAAYTRTSLTLCGSDATLPIGRAFYPDFIEKMDSKDR